MSHYDDGVRHLNISAAGAVVRVVVASNIELLS